MELYGYDLPLEKLLAEIADAHPGLEVVGLQFPDGLRDHATEIAQIVERGLGATPVISADPCYGACDLCDDEMAKLGVPVLIHVGHTEMPSVPTQHGVQVYFVPAHSTHDIQPVVMKACQEFPPGTRTVGITTTAQHTHKLQEAAAILEQAGFEPLVGRGDARTAQAGQLLGCNVMAATRLVVPVEGAGRPGTGAGRPRGGDHSGSGGGDHSGPGGGDHGGRGGGDEGLPGSGDTLGLRPTVAPVPSTGDSTQRPGLRMARNEGRLPDAYLFIGSGDFHPLALALETDRPIIAADPYHGTVGSLDPQKHQILKQRYAAIGVAKGAKSFGIVLSTKGGQMRFRLALALLEKLKRHGREAYIIQDKQISPADLLYFRRLDAFVGVACPRVPIDDQGRYDKPFLTPQELDIVLGERRDDLYVFDTYAAGSG